MTYKLCRELKEAGFKGSGGWVKRKKGDDWKPLNDCEMDGYSFTSDFKQDYDTPYPSLEELIDSCGDGFKGLMREPQSDGSVSWWCESKYPHENQNHKTKKEAVAKLFIELNKK